MLTLRYTFWLSLQKAVIICRGTESFPNLPVSDIFSYLHLGKKKNKLFLLTLFFSVYPKNLYCHFGQDLLEARTLSFITWQYIFLNVCLPNYLPTYPFSKNDNGNTGIFSFVLQFL